MDERRLGASEEAVAGGEEVIVEEERHLQSYFGLGSHEGRALGLDRVLAALGSRFSTLSNRSC